MYTLWNIISVYLFSFKICFYKLFYLYYFFELQYIKVLTIIIYNWIKLHII